jgi:C4-type Zn-finger protein
LFPEITVVLRDLLASSSVQSLEASATVLRLEARETTKSLQS